MPWGVLLTIELSLGALGRVPERRPFRYACATFIRLFQNTPLLLQLFLVYFGVNIVGSNNVTALRLAAANPSKGIEKKLALRSQYQGITLRRGSDDLRQWGNTFLFFIKNTGDGRASKPAHAPPPA